MSAGRIDEMRSDTLSSRKAEQLALAALLLFVLAWDLWAVVADQRLSGSDTFTPDVLTLERSLEEGQLGAWWLGRGPKGPVPAWLSLPLLTLVDDAPLATRLLSVLAHGLMMLQVFALARRLWGRGSAGLWAALLCGVSPLIVGWSRLDYQEPLLTVFVLAGLQLMVGRSFDRTRHWLGLGALLGVGLMVKVSLAVLMLAPGIWLVARHCRGVRGALHLALCLATAFVVCAPWALPNLEAILLNFQQSRHQELGALLKTGRYLALPGVAPLALVALASLVVLWVKRRIDRWQLALFAACLLGALALFFWVFDYWSRYIVPALAVAAVPAGCGLAWAQARLPARARARAGWAAAAALLALFVGLNLGCLGPEAVREHGLGLLVPDRRAHVGFIRAARALRPFGDEVLWVYDSTFAMHRTEGLEFVWRFRGVDLQVIRPPGFVASYRPGRQISVLLVGTAPDDLVERAEPALWHIPPGDPGVRLQQQTMRWLVRQPRRRLAATRDPDGVRYTAFRVTCGPTPPGTGTGSNP